MGGDSEAGPVESAFEESSSLALEVVAKYCRPELESRRWIGDLYPYLTQSAALALQTVDPVNVPCGEVTGSANPVNGDGAFTMRVMVPTDAGEYQVYLHREQLSDEWAVNEIRPAAGQ
ncbi:hypothetical protein DDQ50_16425 [Amnibacterium flavum]|uniref:Uncharacterized protein n=1 Tax=Amnibacterium flavum TaxID=2173173 RepID=A0A2V1HT72_9MICO|nr:hypothetical protein DDQ50_16425 [Amnibacterium flavum]